LATTAIGAALVDLHPTKGALVNGVAPLAGLGLGAIGAGLLIEFAPAPTQLVYVVLLAALLLQAAFLLHLPESVSQRQRFSWRMARPVMQVPASAQVTLKSLLPVNTAQWALAGFFFSLGPSVARALTGTASVLPGALLLGLIGLASACAVVLARAISPGRATVVGVLALAGGGLAVAAAVASGQSMLGVLGSALSGAGFGIAFSGSVRALVPLARPQERAGLMSAFFTASYLAFSVPAILGGLATIRYGLNRTAIVYCVASSFLALLALVDRKRPAAGSLA